MCLVSIPRLDRIGVKSGLKAQIVHSLFLKPVRDKGNQQISRRASASW